MLYDNRGCSAQWSDHRENSLRRKMYQKNAGLTERFAVFNEILKHVIDLSYTNFKLLVVIIKQTVK